MERMTRLELATSTLARWRSTRWATSAFLVRCQRTLWCLRSESNQWHGDFQSPALPTELQRQIWRPGTGSNRRPLAWQASVLTSWTTGPYPERFGPILFELRPNAFSFIRKTCGGNNRARTCDPLLVRQVTQNFILFGKNRLIFSVGFYIFKLQKRKERCLWVSKLQ